MSIVKVSLTVSEHICSNLSTSVKESRVALYCDRATWSGNKADSGLVRNNNLIRHNGTRANLSSWGAPLVVCNDLTGNLTLVLNLERQCSQCVLIDCARSSLNPGVSIELLFAELCNVLVLISDWVKDWNFVACKTVTIKVTRIPVAGNPFVLFISSVHKWYGIWAISSLESKYSLLGNTTLTLSLNTDSVLSTRRKIGEVKSIYDLIIKSVIHLDKLIILVGEYYIVCNTNRSIVRSIPLNTKSRWSSDGRIFSQAERSIRNDTSSAFHLTRLSFTSIIDCRDTDSVFLSLLETSDGVESLGEVRIGVHIIIESIDNVLLNLIVEVVVGNLPGDPEWVNNRATRCSWLRPRNWDLIGVLVTALNNRGTRYVNCSAWLCKWSRTSAGRVDRSNCDAVCGTSSKIENIIGSIDEVGVVVGIFNPDRIKVIVYISEWLPAKLVSCDGCSTVELTIYPSNSDGVHILLAALKNWGSRDRNSRTFENLREAAWADYVRSSHIEVVGRSHGEVVNLIEPVKIEVINIWWLSKIRLAFGLPVNSVRSDWWTSIGQTIIPRDWDWVSGPHVANSLNGSIRHSSSHTLEILWEWTHTLYVLLGDLDIVSCSHINVRQGELS